MIGVLWCNCHGIVLLLESAPSGQKLKQSVSSKSTDLLHNIHKVIEDGLPVLAAGLLQESEASLHHVLRHARHCGFLFVLCAAQ